MSRPASSLGRCETTGKHCYPTARDARITIKRSKRSGNAWQLRTLYVCVHCGHWHTSSRRKHP